MVVTLHSSASAETAWQQLGQEWFGTPIVPPFEFRFCLTEDSLVFSARRAAPALHHPEAQEGRFQELLWKYDTAEFFIATAEADRYVEVNIAPNGAWWSAAFTGPRVVNPAFPARPEGVCARGQSREQGWECSISIPLAYLRLMGIEPGSTPCRIAATAILNSPEQLFLTTATNTSGKPDFHHPWDWEFCLAELRE